MISKSDLTIVSAPHVWPIILSSLVWLCELTLYYQGLVDSIDSCEESSNIVELNPTVAFYKFLGDAYKAFLQGNDALLLQLEAQLSLRFDSSNDLIRDDIDEWEKMNSTTELAIDEVKSRSARVPILQAKLRDLKWTGAQLRDEVDEQQRTVDGLRGEVALGQDHLEELNSSVNAQSATNAKLTDRIRIQNLTPNDVFNMETELARQKDLLALERDENHSVSMRVRAMEFELRGKVAGLQKFVKAYMSVAKHLYLVPHTARSARGKDLSIAVNLLARKRRDLLNIDVRDVILPLLRSLQADTTATTGQLQSDLLAAEEALDQVQASKEELMDADKDCKGSLYRLKMVEKREKNALDHKMAARATELLHLEHRLSEVRDNAADEALIALSERRMAETEALRAVRREEHERKKRAILTSITTIASQCAEHKESLHLHLAGLSENLSPFLLDLLTAPPLQLSDTDLPQSKKQKLQHPEQQQQHQDQQQPCGEDLTSSLPLAAAAAVDSTSVGSKRDLSCCV
eukprot:gene22047-28142_t